MLPHYAIHRSNVFMHDGAPCHTAKVVKTFLRRHRVDVLEWPGNSPDLNPIENCWAIMKNKVGLGDISSVPRLMQQIRDIWVKEMELEYF